MPYLCPLKFKIDKDLIMRKRGVGVLKRVEIWCPTRASARDLHQKLTRKGNKKEGHISLGPVSYTHLDVYKRQGY